MENFKCCICGRLVNEWGNDPYPYGKNDSDMCCDICNSMYVIPARINLMYRKKEENA